MESGNLEISMTAEDAPSQKSDQQRRMLASDKAPQHPRIDARATSSDQKTAAAQKSNASNHLALDHISGQKSDRSQSAKAAVQQAGVQQVAARSPSDALASDQPQTDEQRAIMEAFSDYPPEVQKEALRRLLAATAKKAEKSNQPSEMTAAIQRSMGNLPDLPALSGKPADNPALRLTDDSDSDHSGHTAEDRSNRSRRSSAVVTVSDKSSKTNAEMKTAAQPNAAQPNAAQSNAVAQSESTKQTISAAEFEALKSGGLESTVVQSINDSKTNESSAVQPASAARESGANDPMIARATPTDVDDKLNPNAKSATSPTVSLDPSTLNDAELYRALLKKLTIAPEGESKSERASRLIKLRHMMVLSGDVDSAVAGIDGMTDSEQEFLRHQLLGLWTMVDPAGHPVASRRITTALPQLREATKFAAAATDTLELRSLSFCTEIESYGQIKPFSGNRFSPGQQVILYCEIENFTAKQITDGFETHLQGSFDIYDGNNQKVVSQLLPEDRQTSSNYLRDYYIAYQMHLPKQLAPGTYRMQLTMEDVAGKKYGQASIPLEIAAQ
ncbi:hypothetical protein [Rubripirellula amarantea]|nr:hypothetical protein [Rubripirellula amarantea]